MKRAIPFLFVAALLVPASQARGEVILQWFETPWTEVEARIPEVAAAGYGAIWLPPPTKGADGVADVGFAVFDRFDLGDRDQRGTVKTRYGTLAELQSMVRTAHRYGIRVYFDTVMNHNSNPSRVEFAGGPSTPPTIADYPGLSPLDFHVLPANEGMTTGTFVARQPQEMGGGTVLIQPGGDDSAVAAVRIADLPTEWLPPGGANHPSLVGYTHLVRAPRVGNFDYEWESQNYSLLGLIDIVTEQYANTAGPTSGDGINTTMGTPLLSYIRLPDRPETYPDNTPVAEDPREFQMRWIRWLGRVTDADGFRLDAIKHVPTTFFAEDFPGDPLSFNKIIQDDYDARRGNTDVNDDDLVDDAAIFGESFEGRIEALQPYRATGMRLLNFPLFFKIKDGVFYSGDGAGNGDMGQLTFPHGGQTGELVEFGGLGRWDGVSFMQSHDECPPGTPVRNTAQCTPGVNGQDDLAQAFVLMRVGDGVVFFDGNRFTVATFVRAGRPDALGDLSPTAVRLVRATEDNARGGMFNRFVDDDAYVFERIVDGFGAAALVVLHDNIGSDGRVTNGYARFGEFDPRPLIVTAFPPGTVLEELTGNAPAGSESLVVLDPANVAQNGRDAAYAAHTIANGGNTFLPPDHGLIYFGVSSGPVGNYLVYAPMGSVATGSAAVEILTGGMPAPVAEVQTVGARTSHLGADIPPATYQRSLVPQTFTVRVSVDNTTNAVAGVDIDDGAAPGLGTLSGTSEGLADGMGAMAAMGNAFVADVGPLSPGEHLVVVRIITDVVGAAPRKLTLRTFVTVTPVDGGMGGEDAGMDAGVVDAGMRDGGGMDAHVVTDAARRDASEAEDGATSDEDAGVGGDAGNEDPDNDGARGAADNCPTVSNTDQVDFDGDSVGDACDLCPSDGDGLVDDQGCRRLDPADAERLQRMMEIVVGIRPNAEGFDEDGDGDVDAVDVARAIVEVQR